MRSQLPLNSSASELLSDRFGPFSDFYLFLRIVLQSFRTGVVVVVVVVVQIS